MTARQRRMTLVAVVLGGVIVSATFALRAFEQNLLYFFSPTEIVAGEVPTDRTLRLGGLVQEGSITRDAGSLTVNFVVTDHANTVPVTYTGVLPDLFKEGQGVVARGRLEPNGHFAAIEVLAKHDENYMPPEVAEALERGRAASGQ